MKKPSVIAAAIILFLFALSNSNCSKSSSSPAKPTFEVQLQSNATVTNFLVDKNGHSLYFFATDVNGQSNCTGACEANWPVASDSNLTATQLGAGLTASDFASIKTSEGKTQLTYKGWPLYNFSPGGAQEAAGQTTGDGADAGLFVIAKPDYTIMLGNGQLHGLDGNDYTSTYTIGQGLTTYFTDAWGATLYTFVIDSANHNKFTKSDFSNNATFPIYDTTSIVVPSTVNKALFSNTTVFGKNQLSYNGYPLYYFGADSSHRGSTKAVSVGPKKWPVATTTTPAAPHP
jgi:predicted lipoprotein with Yx(FWY)xxD motif